MPKGIKAEPFTSETAREAQKKGYEKIKKRMTIREILTVWCSMEPTKANKEKLRKMGFDGDLTNKCLIVAPLLNAVKRGDIKAITLALDLMGENPTRDLEIRKLEAEIQKLETQRLLLEKELKGQSEDERIQVIGDVPKLELYDDKREEA